MIIDLDKKTHPFMSLSLKISASPFGTMKERYIKRMRQMDSKSRIQTTLDAFNSIGATTDGMQRLAYTEEESRVHAVFSEFCVKENLQVRTDEAGNVIARREGRMKEAPAVAVGSHLDTVYSGGKYDGAGGVAAGIELIHRLNEKKVMTDYPIELIAFAGEESSRFGLATIGSKAMTGLLKAQDTKQFKDKDGISLETAMNTAGFPSSTLGQAVREKSAFHAFIELHIEQGRELERKGRKVAIATGIAAPTRLKVTVEGEAAHSGTTPMDIRRDALTSASRLVLDIEEAADQEKKYQTVATVGVFHVFPGAMNTIPGRVEFNVDIRGLDVSSKQRIITAVKEKSRQLQTEKDVEVSFDLLRDEQPILLDENVQQLLAASCREVSVDPLFLPSGAGHDAMNMASICPTGLLFVPSYKGISHNPDEYTAAEDFVTGVDVLEQAVMKLAGAKEVKMSG
ncbi:hydantoinase/carbamoylase family amidase [Halobacillus litoralis]|uniref:Hydantoinase/carbamoylase family amidase n=2 Tax=Halobacillus litoralis TaxID=45668 RepID=A0A845E2W8_9BACI|nr:hydantoinase/carbamoylase family amidase [Halobacillus litoralis]